MTLKTLCCSCILLFGVYHASAQYEALLQQAWTFQQQDQYDSLEVHANRMMTISQEEPKNDKLRYWGLYYKSSALHRKDSTAYFFAEEALKGFEQINDDIGIARTYGMLGLIASYHVDMEKSTGWYEKELHFLDQKPSGLSDSVAYSFRKQTLLNLSLNASRQGNIEKSMNLNDSLMEMAQLDKDTGVLIKVMGNVGLLNFRLGKIDAAKVLFIDAYELAKTQKKRVTIQNLVNNIAGIYYEQGKLDSSLIFSRKSLKMAEEAKDLKSLSIRYINYGSVLGELGKVDSAAYYIHKGIESSKAYGNKESLASAHTFLANLYVTNARDPQKSIRNAKEALAIIQGLEAPKVSLEAYMSLHKAYELLGDYENAFHWYQQFENLEDSLLNEQMLAKLDDWQTKYQTVQKEQEIALLSAENEKQANLIRQNYWMLGSLFGVALLLILTLYFYNRQRILEEKQRAIEIEQRLLRSQMNPHFLFNTLSSIQTFLLEKEDTDQGIYYLSKFSKLMRQVLEHSREKFIPLDDEIKTLENYLTLQKMRHSDQFDFHIEIDEAIDPELVMIPPMMLQPFIENAILHGRIHQMEAGLIHIQVKKERENLILSIEDNGVGRLEARRLTKQPDHKSLSSAILEDRIELLRKTLKKNIGYQIYDLPEQGTRVQFNFPLLLA